MKDLCQPSLAARILNPPLPRRMFLVRLQGKVAF